MVILKFEPGHEVVEIALDAFEMPPAEIERHDAVLASTHAVRSASATEAEQLPNGYRYGKFGSPCALFNVMAMSRQTDNSPGHFFECPTRGQSRTGIEQSVTTNGTSGFGFAHQMFEVVESCSIRLRSGLRAARSGQPLRTTARMIRYQPGNRIWRSLRT